MKKFGTADFNLTTTNTPSKNISTGQELLYTAVAKRKPKD